MLQITRGQSNTVALTLSEAPNGEGATFILRFISTEFGQQKDIVVTDTSAYPDRFNKFVIIETDTPTEANEISMQAGEWLYQAFENDEGEIGSLLEQGQVKVI